MGSVQIGDGEVEKQERRLGRMPIMVRSSRCNLRMLNRQGLVRRGEESTEMGGYFITNGIEKIIRLLVLPKRNYVIALRRSANAKRGRQQPGAGTLVVLHAVVRFEPWLVVR